MALATREHVNAALRALGAPEIPAEPSAEQRVDDLLEEATDLVTGHLHPCPIPTPTPEPISRVIGSMVAAVLNRDGELPDNVSDLTAGIYGAKFEAGTTSPGPYLTMALKKRLLPYRCGNGMVSVPLGSERAQ